MTGADPTEAMRLRASGYPGVDQGTACTQSSFKAGKGAFLFIGPGATGRLEVYGGEAHVVRILEGRGRSGSMSRADALQTVEVCRGK